MLVTALVLEAEDGSGREARRERTGRLKAASHAGSPPSLGSATRSSSSGSPAGLQSNFAVKHLIQHALATPAVGLFRQPSVIGCPDRPAPDFHSSTLRVGGKCPSRALPSLGLGFAASLHCTTCCLVVCAAQIQQPVLHPSIRPDA